MCGTATPCVVDNPSRPEKMRVKTKTKRVDHKHPKPNNWKRESQLLEPANTCPCFCIVWIGVIASNLSSILARSPRTWLAPYPLRGFLASWGKSDTELEVEGVKMGYCCSDSNDDDTKLLGFVLALVLAMMLFIVCHPPHARRVTIYHCTWIVFSTILIIGKLCFCRSFECLLNYLYRHSKCNLQLSSTI